jgi:hypothetical protein
MMILVDVGLKEIYYSDVVDKLSFCYEFSPLPWFGYMANAGSKLRKKPALEIRIDHF